MIAFQNSDKFIDLTRFRLTFNEENSAFIDGIIKNYSFPFSLRLYEELAIGLGFSNVEDVTGEPRQIDGLLIIDDDFHDAYIEINRRVGDRLEMTLYYGKELLEVYDLNLRQLPWPSIISLNFNDHAKDLINKTWPETTHIFPMIFREQLKQEVNYDAFQYFVNHFDGTNYLQNDIDTSVTPNVINNRNVMAPAPFVMAIFKQIYAYEGKEVIGDFIDHPILRKMVLQPKAFMENFDSTTFQQWSFDYPTEQNNFGNVYERSITVTLKGTYRLKAKINMNSSIANTFSFDVALIRPGGQIDTVYSASGFNQNINIDEEIEININEDNQYQDLRVRISMTQIAISIEPFNSFTFQFWEGGLNVFPPSYTLADFVPDMKVREFVNQFKNLFNLDIDINESFVSIGFMEETLRSMTYDDLTEFQEKNPKIRYDRNNIYQLKLADGTKISVDSQGLNYSLDFDRRADVEDIEVEGAFSEIEENESILTAKHLAEPFEISIAIYDGPLDDIPLLTDQVDGTKLNLSYIYDYFYRWWLDFRTRSINYVTKFKTHITRDIDLKKGTFIYNRKHLVRKVRKRRVEQEFWEYEVESETL